MMKTTEQMQQSLGLYLRSMRMKNRSKPGASSFSSSTQRMEDHLLNELCLIPRCNREDNSQDWPQTLDNKVGDIDCSCFIWCSPRSRLAVGSLLHRLAKKMGEEECV